MLKKTKCDIAQDEKREVMFLVSVFNVLFSQDTAKGQSSFLLVLPRIGGTFRIRWSSLFPLIQCSHNTHNTLRCQTDCDGKAGAEEVVGEGWWIMKAVVDQTVVTETL